MKLPRLTPEQLVEELREKARDEAEDLNMEISVTALKIGAAKLWAPEHMLEWEAADMIEDLVKKLRGK
ncbi:hypothetical protein V5F49_20480 [Xanthobacter sp. V3C-3]|uniref:hypothetical protein n=1 Tax=Xanthobacter lutulentifluminis TaxID=3119935 RepID=UPI00372BB9CA